MKLPWWSRSSFASLGTRSWSGSASKIRGAGSGIETDFVHWSVWTFNEAGVMTWFEIYLPNQEAEAIEAAGCRCDLGAGLGSGCGRDVGTCGHSGACGSRQTAKTEVLR
jgi:hypothetical protein